MEPKEFTFWLKGYTDGIGVDGPSKEHWSKIQHELALVFNKITPYRPNINEREIYCSSLGGVSVAGGPVTLDLIPRTC